ncbi:MAG: RNA pseudouridine synthase [Deltaproteobacteria bacterium]|nr:RNA pseudouridine synthase [Deltaproteobacteria bacterium]|tara:strand:- start:3180 stop:4166 length:987 start_codon:yes stop_codon:yes gene_type:complete
MTDYIRFNVKESEAGMRLDQFLASMEKIVSRSEAQRILRAGNVLINGVSVSTPSRKVYSGQSIFLTVPDNANSEINPEKGEIDVLYEDSALVVVNKPSDMVVHPSVGHSSGTLVNYLMYHCNDLSGIGGVFRPGIVHRLDKDTSGILVVAKNDIAHLNLSSQFKRRTVKRQYQALVWGVPEKDQGVVEASISRHPSRRKEMTVVKKELDLDGENTKGKHAVTHWKVLKRFKNATLIVCRLETGRTHQIRVHLNSIGHPLIGDKQYGKSPLKDFSGLSLKLFQSMKSFRRQALHAELLGFKHPVTDEWCEFRTNLPKDFRNLLTEMQKL